MKARRSLSPETFLSTKMGRMGCGEGPAAGASAAAGRDRIVQDS